MGRAGNPATGAGPLREAKRGALPLKVDDTGGTGGTPVWAGGCEQPSPAPPPKPGKTWTRAPAVDNPLPTLACGHPAAPGSGRVCPPLPETARPVWTTPCPHWRVDTRLRRASEGVPTRACCHYHFEKISKPGTGGISPPAGPAGQSAPLQGARPLGMGLKAQKALLSDYGCRTRLKIGVGCNPQRTKPQVLPTR
jgi:hypothetical protein